MTKYNCIIIDDEPQAVEILVEYISLLNKNVQILNTYTNWSTAIEGMRSQNCEILFLDISINGKNGMDLLKLMPEMKSEIIFVTAYSEHALNAIKYSPCGYVLKPVDEIELGVALDKAIERVNTKRAIQHFSDRSMNEKVGIFNNKGIDYVDIKEIIYFEGINQYTKVVTHKSQYTSSYHLGRFSNITDNYPFYKIHRSYIVNVENVLRYETAGLVIMSNKNELPVSRTQRNEFLKIFNAIH